MVKLKAHGNQISNQLLIVKTDKEKASNTDIMEEQKVMNNNGRKRTHISIIGVGGGGGIGGLLVLGGALALIGLIAVTSFATKKNKAKNCGLKKSESESQEKLDHNDSKNEDDTIQGLGSVLQNSTTNDEIEW